MPTTPSPLKRAITAAKRALGPQRYGSGDRVLACPMCGHDHFDTGPYMVLFGVWTLVCAECRHISPFERLPERTDA